MGKTEEGRCEEEDWREEERKIERLKGGQYGNLCNLIRDNSNLCFEYYYGDMDECTTLRVKEHISSCYFCRESFETLMRWKIKFVGLMKTAIGRNIREHRKRYRELYYLIFLRTLGSSRMSYNNLLSLSKKIIKVINRQQNGLEEILFVDNALTVHNLARSGYVNIFVDNEDVIPDITNDVRGDFIVKGNVRITPKGEDFLKKSQMITERYGLRKGALEEYVTQAKKLS